MASANARDAVTRSSSPKVKIKGTPAGVKSLLSGGGRTGAMINGGEPGSRETQNKVKVDQSPSAAPRRTSNGARRVSAGSLGSQAVASEPNEFGQPFSM